MKEQWVVVNRCFGGFSLSPEGAKALGAKANGRFANLQVVSIPANVEWVIDEYDGSESVEEKYRSW